MPDDTAYAPSRRLLQAVKMNRTIKIGLLTISVLTTGLVIAYGIYLSTFDLFGEPEKEIIEINCDYEGLRQATIFEYGGNATTIPAIKVSIDLGCSGNPDGSDNKIVFSADHTGGTNVETKWKSFDTLRIIYSNELEPITRLNQVTYSDSSLNVIIDYETN